jgi:hypothetical protein
LAFTLPFCSKNKPLAEIFSIGDGVGVAVVAVGDEVRLNVESAGAVVGVALDVRNVITVENDTNLARRSTANLTLFP